MAGLFKIDRRSNPLLYYDLRAIWMVRSKVLFRELGFWLMLLGYEPKKRRFSSPLYLIYAIVFLTIWALMVFLLLANTLAQLLTAVPAALAVLPMDPAQNAVILGGVIVLGFFLTELNQAVRRSPMVFSSQDAQIFCTTPIDRRWIALAWFLETWVSHSAILWIVLAALAGAVFQLQAPPEFTPGGFFRFGQTVLQAASIAAPLMMSVLAAAWAAGLWRLRGQNAPPWMKWMPNLGMPLLTLLLAAGLLAIGWNSFFSSIFPVQFIIRSMLGLSSWAGGFLTAMLLAGAGLALVWGVSKKVSVARAAQETEALYTLQAAVFLRRADLVDDLRFQRRLGVGRGASRWLAGTGWRVFVWKSWLQLRYLLQPQDVLLWMGIIGLNLGLLAFHSIEAGLFMGLMWVVLVLQTFEPVIQRLMSRWWLLRSLPFRSVEVVASTILPPLAGTWLAGLVSILIALWIGWEVPIQVVWVYAALVPGILLCGTMDVFQHARAPLLNDGLCPGPELLAVLGSGLLAALFLGGAWLLFTYLRLLWLPALVLLMLFTGTVLFALLHFAGWMLTRIK